MFILRTALKSVFRNGIRSLGTFLSVAAMACFIILFSQNICRLEDELTSIAETVPVKAEILSLTGAGSPRIEQQVVEEIFRTGFVREANLKAELFYAFPESKPNKSGSVCSCVTSCGLERQLSRHLDSIVWAENWDLEKWETSNDGAVILPLSYGITSGSITEMTFALHRSAAAYTDKVFVAGVYNDSLDEEDYIMSLEGESYIFATVSWLEKITENGAFGDERPVYSYASFLLTHCENINDFKSKMQAMGFNQPDTGLKLVITDRLLASAIDPLLKNISLQKNLLPLMFFMVAVLGAALCFLSINSRRREFAVMRSLGGSACTAFASGLSELLLLCVMGFALGSTVYFRAGTGMSYSIIVLIFTACFMAGGSVSLLPIASGNVLELLHSDKE